MARRLRLGAEDGVHHVINRGNYRAPVFRSDQTKAGFLRCLDETCVRTGWRVHAWCIMSNHYHLAVTTPQGNLVDGMRSRFNRLRNERGTSFRAATKPWWEIRPMDSRLNWGHASPFTLRGTAAGCAGTVINHRNKEEVLRSFGLRAVTSIAIV